METFSLPAARLPLLTERFEKLAKRAKRLKVPAPSFEVVRLYTKETGRTLPYIKDGKPQVWRETVEMADVVYTGERPSAGPFEVVANLVNTPAGNVVRVREGFEVPERYRTRHVCDHCGTKRNRKETWLFRHKETGKLMQVARNCAQDFVGSAELNLNRLSMVFEAWGAFDCSGAGWSGWGLREYLAQVAACVRVDRHYLSRSKARDTGRMSTAVYASQCLSRWTNAPELAEKEGLPRATGDDYAATEAALAWLETTPAASDYIHNLKAAVSLGYVTAKTEGYIASLVGAAYPRAVAKEAKRERAASRDAGSEHIGQIKERLELSVTVERVRQWEGNFGLTTYIRMRTPEGNLLQWYASGDRDVREGSAHTIKATVKRHDTDRYTGAPVTTVTRCAGL